MAAEIERLVVSLEATVNKYEKALAKANAVTMKEMGAIEKRTSKMSKAVPAMMATAGMQAAKAFAAPFAAIGIGGIIHQVSAVSKAVAEIGDEAKRAGVGVEAFQELGFVARQNRISMDALTDGLKELNLRADEFIVTGGGSASEAFQRLGYSAEELKAKLADPSALFSEIIGKLQHLDQAAQIRIADEIFGGTGGEKFVQLIEQGEQGIKDTIRQARSLGIVMSEDLIDKAADLDQKFQTVSETVGTALKSAIVSAADALSEFMESFHEFITTPDRIIAGQGQPLWDQMTPEQRNKFRLDVQLSGVRKSRDLYAAFGLNPDGTFKIEPPEVPVKPGGNGGSGSGSGGAGSRTSPLAGFDASLAEMRERTPLLGLDLALLEALS